MISFCGPCLKYKLVFAFKGHNGYNGFVAPYQNKYLKRVVKLTLDQSGFFYPGGIQVYPGDTGISTTQDEFDIDPLTGFLTNIPNGSTGGQHFFPYFGAPLPPPVAPAPGAVNVTASDNHYTITTYFDSPPLTGLAKNITEVTLSNQYTLGQLDADTDALVNSIDPSTIPFGQGQVVIYENDAIGGPDLGTIYQGVAQILLPPIAQYFPPRGPFDTAAGIPFSRKLASPFAVESVGTPDGVGAAAGYVYAPSPFGEPIIAPFDKPGCYMKFVAWVSMAGTYCQKDFYLDYNQVILSQKCTSGIGSCSAAPFKVNAPPIVIGQDAYTLIVPNCQCS